MSANSSVIKKEEKAKNIQVVVRCRPFNTAERRSSHCVVECDHGRREVQVRTAAASDKSARKTYTFDMVFGPSAKQIEVYRSVVCPILDEVIMGYNCTVFAYGQTGTGKTFTMEGERSPNEEFTWEEDPLAGIIPRTLHQIFQKLSENGTEFSVKVSLLEIYNEELFDLLSPSADVTERLQMFDDPRNKRGVIIKGLEEITVHNKDEVYQILERGAAKRKTASTLMNAYSSRSHSVFSVTIHMKETTLDGEELVKIGKLNLVDLAGSENIGRSGAVDKRAREAGNINQSLLTLGRVITALVERAPHVPYRESKLTRILQDSLGGRTKTSIIATVSPASVNLEETLSTLDYANRAKNIMNKPEVNQKLTKRALIKEYTEEIERLKRDLAAARDKNGVYLSTENYDSMNSKIVLQEEQIAEFTEKISALEEEMKRVMDMFSDSKRELEQCTEDLRKVRQQLEEARRDLQSTKVRLREEEFIVTQLESTESQLYGTAGELLTTVEVTTRDVSGLHEKLARKNAVELHNMGMQADFAERMEAAFAHMQRSIDEQNNKHQEMLSLYSASIETLLSLNRSGFSNATSVITASFKGIKDLVEKSVVRCQAGMAEQELLCQAANDKLNQMLEEHKINMEEGLLAIILPGLNAVMEMNETMKQTLKTSTTLAEKMETLKLETASFFTEHASALAKMRECVGEGLRSLHVEQKNLKEQIEKANKKHTSGMSQVISCLQNQLNLLALETQNDFKELLSQSDAVQVPVDTLQQSIQLQCNEVAQRADAHWQHLESSADRLITEARRAAEEGSHTVEECAGQCGYLKTSITQLAEAAARQTVAASGNAACFAEEQLSMIKARKASVQELQQCVEAGCGKGLEESSSLLQLQQSGVEDQLGALEKRFALDEATLHQRRTQLSSHASEALTKVNAFLKDELRQDIPTGQTPQRKDYIYPKFLTKTKERKELLENFRQQQQALQEALSTCDTVKEQIVEQDSLEEEVSTSNDSAITEHSYVEENMICSENGRAPFFKHKKVGKKENKNSLDQSKMLENEKQLTPLRSKLPLRAQN